jgi:HPt (histidine-containing phosphotransfer) domain-containing protein
MPSHTLQTVPLLDETVVHAMAADLGTDTCQQLVQLFITELQQLQQDITVAMTNKSLPDILSAVHILKNSAALYGAQRLALLANTIHSDTTAAPALIYQNTANLVDILCQTLALYQSSLSAQGAEGDDDE